MAHVRRIAAAELEPHADEASAAARCMAWPPATEPVNATKATRGSLTTRSVSSCDRCRTWNTPSGRPRLAKAFRETLGAQRRLRGVLQHHGVARHDRRHDAVHRDEIRIVPGRDGEHDAQRLAAHEALEIRLSARRRCRRALRARWRSCSARARACRALRSARSGSGRPICQVSSSAIASRLRLEGSQNRGRSRALRAAARCATRAARATARPQRRVDLAAESASARST